MVNEGEELGSGMCSTVTKAKVKGAGEDAEIFFIKRIAGEMIWTADNELPGLELAGNYPGVVKCYKIYDNRGHADEKEHAVSFVLELVEGGYLEGWLQQNHADGTYLSKDQWIKWSLQMAETVSVVHDRFYMIHCDLHQKNWLLTKENDMILADFGCSRVIGPGGKVPVGTKVFYADMHSPPEMQYPEGTSFFTATTKEEFDFRGDVFQTAFAMQCMLVQGEWIMHRPTPNNYGQDVVDLIAWMKSPDQKDRPYMREVKERLLQLKANYEANKEKPFVPSLDGLFKGDLTKQHAKLSAFRQTLPAFFPESITDEEKEFHDHLDELRADGDPVPVDSDGYQGSYLGQFSRKGKFDGRGVLLQKRSLYEGFFKDGKKFGRGREVKLSFGSPFIKVIEGSYADGGVAQGEFTETFHAISKEQPAQTIVRTYEYASGVIQNERDAQVTYADGTTAGGQLESMIEIVA